MAGLHLSIELLNNTKRKLQQRWENTQPLWKDEVSQRFEKDFMLPLESQNATTLQEMRNLSQVLIDAHNNVH